MAVNAYDSDQDILMQDHLQYQQELQHLIQSQGRYMNSPQQQAYKKGMNEIFKSTDKELKDLTKWEQEFHDAGYGEWYDKFIGGDQKDENGNVVKEGMETLMDKVNKKIAAGSFSVNDPDRKALEDMLNTIGEAHKNVTTVLSNMKKMGTGLTTDKSHTSQLYEGYQNTPMFDKDGNMSADPKSILYPNYNALDAERFTDTGNKYYQEEANANFNSDWNDLSDQVKAQILLEKTLMKSHPNEARELFQQGLHNNNFKNIFDWLEEHGGTSSIIDSLRQTFHDKAKRNPSTHVSLTTQEKRDQAAINDMPSIYADQVADRIKPGNRGSTNDRETWNTTYGTSKKMNVVFGPKGKMQHATFGQINNTNGAHANAVSDKNLSNKLIDAWVAFGSLYNKDGILKDVNYGKSVGGSTKGFVGATELDNAGISQKQIDAWVKSGVLKDVGGISQQTSGVNGLINEKLSDKCYTFIVDIPGSAITHSISHPITGVGNTSKEGNVAKKIKN